MAREVRHFMTLTSCANIVDVVYSYSTLEGATFCDLDILFSYILSLCHCTIWCYCTSFVCLSFVYMSATLKGQSSEILFLFFDIY
jgi:hypothetical protein